MLGTCILCVFKFYFHLLVMSTLGPLLPSTSVGYDAVYSWQSRTVAESSFYNVFHSPGRVFQNGDVFHGARLGGFSFFASLPRYALTCICKMFGWCSQFVDSGDNGAFDKFL